MTDPIADLLTRIRNAELAHHNSVVIPYSKEKESILKVMKNYKYIKSFEIKKENGSKFNSLFVQLDTDKEYKTYYKRISTPGQRIYVKNDKIKTIKSGLGISIISTPKGIMSNLQAKKENVGGEILCEIW